MRSCLMPGNEYDKSRRNRTKTETEEMAETKNIWRRNYAFSGFSGDNFSIGLVGKARRFHSSIFNVTPMLDTGFSIFVSLGSRASTPTSETFEPFVSSGMRNFRLVTTCSQTVNGKRVVTKKVLEDVRGKNEAEKERLFHEIPPHHWKLMENPCY
nr:sterile alpha motif domain-containing protein 13 isoform X1 [Macaca nemestrina]